MTSDPNLSRRSLLALVATSLSACGGGAGGLSGLGSTASVPGTGGTGTLAGLPGTGGTGIFSLGSISGFGSVIVNGIKFDDMQATVKLDGVGALPTDLRLGMVASVQGVQGTDTMLGTASSIDVWSMAQGTVAQVASGQFTVSGMTVQIDSGTVFSGIASAAALAVGLRVAVWGLQASVDGSRWTATRVALVPAAVTATVSSGVVSVAGSLRTLNGLLLTGVLASQLVAGQLARVQGDLSASGSSFQVQSIRLLGTEDVSLLQGVAEIEGLVTVVLSATRFKLGYFEVDTSAASFSPSTGPLTVGTRVEVKGTWGNGVLKASKVEMQDAQTLGEVEIEARIEQFTSVANFVVRGQRCDATGVTISHGTVVDLKVGVKVHIKGTKAGDVVKVTQLELDI